MYTGGGGLAYFRICNQTWNAVQLPGPLILPAIEYITVISFRTSVYCVLSYQKHFIGAASSVSVISFDLISAVLIGHCMVRQSSVLFEF